MFKIFFIFCLMVLSYTGEVIFEANSGLATFAHIEGITSTGESKSFYFDIHNLKRINLPVGTYVLKVRHPGSNGISFNSTQKVIISNVEIVEGKPYLTRTLVKRLFPVSTAYFEVKEKITKVAYSVPLKMQNISKRVLDIRAMYVKK